MLLRFIGYCICFLVISVTAGAQTKKTDTFYLLKPDRVFDGRHMNEGWQVLVKNHTIEAVGASVNAPKEAIIIPLKGCTVLPGLIEGHSHLFLHPYNEVSWDDQVLNESRAERTARAVNHARATLMAGFTTVRDLGTEGAGYDDAGLKKAIEKGVIPGPRMLIATRAIVATGSYGPKSEVAEIDFPRGAAEVGGPEELGKEIRTQIGKGADIIKLYADYRWGVKGEAQPTFTEAELAQAVLIAGSSGRPVVVHASTAEGMRRAAMAGVATIEHGDNGTPEVFALMKVKGVAFCPTLAASDAILQYAGWKKGIEEEPARIRNKKKSFAAALAAGVTICMGGDVGVFTHGDNAREMEMMVNYGMKPIEVLRSATAVNAEVFHINNEVGSIAPGLLADIIAVEGDPSVNITQVRKVKLVMKNGVVYKEHAMHLITFSPGILLILVLLVVMAAISVIKKKLTIAAGLVAVLVGLAVFAGIGVMGIILLSVFFMLGVLATSHKKELKASLHPGAGHPQTRNAGQVLANGGVAALFSLLALIDPPHTAIYSMMVAASLASAAADTLSSELGMVYGGNTFNVLTLKKEPAGLDGVISMEGTLIGAAGSAAVAVIWSLEAGFGKATFLVAFSGIIGNFFDSILGALLERKRYIGNDLVNFLNTLLAALVSWLLYQL